FVYNPTGREVEGRRIAKSEKELRERFKLVIDSIDKNNPVHFDSGLTTGCNHFVTLNGYATIEAQGQERLWICVANPAGTEEWLPTLDLTLPNVDLDKLRPEDQAITLVRGDWDRGRAAMQLLRADVFFLPKTVEDIPRFRTKASE